MLVALLAVPTASLVTHAAPGDGAWQVQLDKVAPDPVESGVPSAFLLALQCSAIEAPTCVDGVVTIPLPQHILPVVDVDPHPFVVDRTVADGVLRLTLAPSFPAGASLQVGIRFTAANVTTPDGHSPTFTATVTGANTPAVSDTAIATFTATPSLGVTKRLPSNAPDGTRFPLDTPLRYSVSVCDSRGLGDVGVLGMEAATVVDTLPTGATFVAASGGGVYDAGAGTVTWQLGPQTGLCYDDTLTVDVLYATGDVDPDSTVTNTVDVTGRPLAQTDDVTASDSVSHGFGDPVAVGDFCKAGDSPVTQVQGACGSGVDTLTFVGPWRGEDREMPRNGFGAESTFDLSIGNASTVGGTVDLVDPVPCRTSSDGATPATYTSNAPGEYCTDPAWIVTGFRSVSLFPTAGFPQAILDGNHPTYVTTTGEERDFVAHPETHTTGAAIWLFTPQPGDVVSEIRWTEVPVPVGSGSRGNFARVYGYLAEDLEVGDRVTNVAWRTLTVGASVLTGSAEASIVGIDETIASVGKIALQNGTFELHGGAISATQPVLWTSGLVIADLLPVELQAVTLVSARHSPGPATTSEPMPASRYQIEQIPDYEGTGRTLIRITVPPGGTLAAGPFSTRFTFAPADGVYPWIGTRTNTVRGYLPGIAIDRCATSAAEFIGGGPAATEDVLDWDGDGTAVGDSYCSATTNLTRASGGAAVQVTKQVRGNLDTTYAAYPKVALADPSLPGDAGYRLTVRNSGGAHLRDAVLYDLLPTVGDTGVSAGQVAQPRGSTFTPILTGQLSVDSDPSVTWEVAYSTAANPCRPEVGDGSATWPPGCTDDWDTTPPLDLAAVTALRIRQTGGLLTADAAPSSSATFSWPMSTPPTAQVGDVAWNTTAVVATNDSDGVALLASEPPKVGLTVPEADVELDKVADRAAGAIGEVVTFTLTASHGTTIATNPDGSVSYLNDGDVTTAVAPATGVVVTDVLPAGLTFVSGSAAAQQGTFDPVSGVWTIGTLEVGAEVTLTYRARITAAGSQTNSAEVTAAGVGDTDSTPGNCDLTPEDDCASATVDNLTLGVALDKLVESVPDSGDYLDADEGTGEYGVYPSGTPVRYRFVVTNTGQSPLSDVTIVDPMIPFFCDAVFDIGTLAPDEQMTIDCTRPIGFGVGTAVNTATVTATTVGGDDLEATDTAQVLVPTPEITVEKTTNGAAADTPAAAAQVAVDDTVTWTYVVRNTGSDELVDVSLVDDREPAVELDAGHCTRSSGAWGDPLAPGATITCVHTGTAVAGLYVNTATARGRGVVTPIVVTAVDTSHYTTLDASTPLPTTSTTTPTTSTTSPTAPTTTTTTIATSGPTTTIAGLLGPETPTSMPTLAGRLPTTGADGSRLVRISIALFAVGCVMVGVRRRRVHS